MTAALRMPTNILVRALWHGLDDTTLILWDHLGWLYSLTSILAS